MLILNYLLIILTSVILINCKSLPSPQNNTAIISKYAKVANFGAAPLSTTQTAVSEGRSSGQSLWTHRSDVNIVGGQNLKSSKPSVVYHYAVYKKPSEKIANSQFETVPAVGEVQERFNPRPYFDYQHVPSKYSPPKAADKAPPSSSDSIPSSAPTFDSFPVFNKPNSPSYDSSVSSYNPPKAGTVSPVDDSNPDIAYPPNGPPPPGDTGDLNSPPPPPSDSSAGYSYTPPNDHNDNPPPPPEPPKAAPMPPPQEQLYYPPSDNGHHQEVILDHPPPGWEEPKDMKNQPAPQDMPAPAQDMAEHDLSPPPSPDYRFPQYLYSDPHASGADHDIAPYDFDDHHHVYKEVTTTPAPEDERVNKGHYSYYYLGRKLWYIPLYFSVYFVVYVTVLILKSIARHKIQFKHEHFHRGARMMNDNNEQIDEIHRNVTEAIDNGRKRIPYIAM